MEDDDDDVEVNIVPLHTIDRTDGNQRYHYCMPGIGTLELVETPTHVSWKLGRFGHNRAK